MKNRQRQKQKNKLRARLLLVAGSVSFVLTITAGIMVYLNVNNVSKTRATATGGEGSGASLGNGDILTEFTWEKDPVTAATLGPDAINVSKDAHSMSGGRSSTGGLSAGANGKDIDLEIEGTELWNQEGIDISIDYSRNEKSGSFFTRENGFNFGMENGFISIAYRLENKRGGIESFKAKTEYEIPVDMNFRTYRFIYNPAKGKAEIFVNSVIVWSNQHAPNTPLSWKNAGKVTIAKGMNGDGKDIAIIDNLIVRTAGNTAPLAESLLNFMLEEKDGGIKIHWSTSVNDKIKSFTIERSINGVDFMNVASVPVNPDMKETEEYTYTDKTKATTGIVYYRLRQTFINGKFISHSLAAIKMQNEVNLAIEKINPLPFDKSFDVSYFLPKSGKVWIQICDESGKILDTQSFDAPKGKNVHVYKNEKIRESGSYTINLIFDNKKVTRSIIKI
ncbi:MAG: hypothetical protein IPN61_08130 [Bacteroidetes bacterium]|nr:hypothetical protein [Bacteroidota bacterium]MBK9413376.1 hypothetical protein [Bacteroidota bacterium]MBP6427137.1 hypothetical protein [Bacteroidia bacterium]MBP6658795.1 hypothetical protein [Bacteroidia bacterium]